MKGSANRSPFIAIRKGIKWWRYEFKYKGKRKKAWMDACSEMTRKEAVDKFKLIYANVVSGNDNFPNQQAPVDPIPIFDEYKKYLKVHRPSTYKSYKYIDHHFVNYFKNKKRITFKIILNYQETMLKTESKAKKLFSEATINRHLAYCRAAFKRAAVEPNPFKDYEKFKEIARTRYLTGDELSALLGKVIESPNPHLGPIVLTGILTGLRKDNILDMHARHIDFGKNIIRMRIKGNEDETFPLPEQLSLIYKRNIKKHASGYVFENPFTHTRYVDVKKGWRTALNDAKVDNFCFHDLRHTFATYTLLATKNVRLVQQLLGHRNITQTQKYTHILFDEKIQAVNLLGSMIEGVHKIQLERAEESE